MTVAKETRKSQPILRQGSTGEDVKHVQNSLNDIYHHLDDLKLQVDGIFGPKTEAAVKKFQSDYGLVVDGIVGLRTWNRLAEVRHPIVTPGFPLLRKGSTGETVRRLQNLLNRRGYNLTIDGIFGVRTEAAVKTFQNRNGLTVDGVVGPQTWEALNLHLHH
ncbi:MAG: peptidoglycan-binding protein [Cyanobacteriota bacterium]|nr:peptidoglycan-binding protein [Cyanobacteriota bacterium]